LGGGQEVIVRAFPGRQEGESTLVEADQLVWRSTLATQEAVKLGGDDEGTSLSVCSGVLPAQSVSLIALTPSTANEAEVHVSSSSLVHDSPRQITAPV
jgi:hypothetical protein